MTYMRDCTQFKKNSKIMFAVSITRWKKKKNGRFFFQQRKPLLSCRDIYYEHGPVAKAEKVLKQKIRSWMRQRCVNFPAKKSFF